MSGSLLIVFLAFVLGWPLAALSGAEPSRSGRAGLALLLGFGSIAILLFVLALAGIPWTGGSVLASIGLLALAASVAAFRVRSKEDAAPARPSLGSAVLLGVAAVLVVGHGLFGVTGPTTEADFLEIWGLKGRVFYEARGVDWSFLRYETTFHNHPDYPPLVPLLFAAAGVMGGEWEDRELGILFTAFGAALLLIAEAALRKRFGSDWLVGAAVVALVPLAMTPWIGIGEGPLLAFASAAMLYVWSGLREGSRAAVMTGAVLLGCAALTKNEGIAMIAAATIALLTSAGGRRAVLRLWPAAVIAAIWIVPRELAGLEGDLTVADPLRRFFARVTEPTALMKLLAAHTPWRPVFWIGLTAGAIVAANRLFREQRILIAFAGIQILFYLGAYAVTPHDLAWHVRWSWERLVTHVAFLATAAVLASLIPTLRGERAGGDAPQ